MAHYIDIFCKIESGKMISCSKTEWKKTEAKLNPIIMDSQIGDVSVVTRFISDQSHRSNIDDEVCFTIDVSSPGFAYAVPRVGSPNPEVGGYITSVEGAKLAHFTLVGVFERLTGLKAKNRIARRAVCGDDTEVPPCRAERM